MSVRQREEIQEVPRRGGLVRCGLLALVVTCALGASATPKPNFSAPHGKAQYGAYVWVWNTFSVAYGGANLVVHCPPHYVVVSGGYNALQSSSGTSVGVNAPKPDFTGWTVSVSVHQSAQVVVYAACYRTP